jgi:peptide/nickel transport system ATP-binding protein
MSAVALPDPGLREKRKRIILEGEIPSPRNPPTGCPFHPRCRYREDRCSSEMPVLQEISDATHLAACHFPERVGKLS